MKTSIAIILTGLMMGCTSVQEFSPTIQSDEQILQKAQIHFEAEEFYTARRYVQSVLDSNPDNVEAQDFMARILDKEIARHKDLIERKTVEELNGEEVQAEIKTWLERSRSLLETQQYDLALFAAEKVFMYDSINIQASELIDDIKEEAIKEGKAESLFVHKMYQEEIVGRVTGYREKAESLVKEGKYGQAKFVIQKILLLEPEDPQALALHKKVLEKTEGKIL